MADKDEVFERGLAAVTALTALLAEETRLIAAGRINDGLALAAEKARLADVLSVALQGLDPARAGDADTERLRQTIEGMQETLAINLAVLATARSVAESLLRDVARQIAPAAPNAYSPGRSRPRARSGPLVLSRAT